MENKRNARNSGKNENLYKSKVGKETSGKTKTTRKKSRKFKNTRLFKILRIALLILIILIIINIISDVHHKTPSEISLIIGDQKITLKNQLLDENNVIYMSKDDIANLYDSNIYYNDESGIVITTYNKHVAKLDIGKNTMEINSTKTAISGTAKKENNVLYLPFTDLDDVYDFKYEYNQDSKALMVDSISKEKAESIVLRTSKVKEEPKGFSDSLEKIKKSSAEYVTVFDKTGDYTKVRTQDGVVGYVKTKNLSERNVLWENMEEEKLSNVKVLNDYNTVGTYDKITVDSNYYNIVTPNLFKINKSLEIENVIDLSSKKYQTYKTWADENNVKIVADVTLDASMKDVCGSYDSRTILINLLYNQFVNNQIEAICIDFDNIDDVEGFYRFVIELTPRFKEVGYKVIVKYKDGLNKDRLEKIVDYVID